MHIRPVLYIIDLDELSLTVKNIQILIKIYLDEPRQKEVHKVVSEKGASSEIV